MARFKFLRQKTLICWQRMHDQDKDGCREATLTALERKNRGLLYTSGSGGGDAKMHKRDANMIEHTGFGSELNAL